MMTEKEFQRRVKNITKAIKTNNIRLLTTKDCRWLIDNYWLRSQSYCDMTSDWKRYSKKDFEHFYSSFDLYEWVIGEVDLNYALTWILHWVDTKSGDPKNVIQSIDNFKQRCRLVQQVRLNIGVKTYNIHYLYSNHVYKRGHDYRKINQFKKYINPMYGMNIQEVIKKFLENRRPDKYSGLPIFKINRVRQISPTAYYTIARDPRMTESLYKFLTTEDSVNFVDPIFDWPWPPVKA